MLLSRTAPHMTKIFDRIIDRCILDIEELMMNQVEFISCYGMVDAVHATIFCLRTRCPLLQEDQ